jgi:hypothetical protein
MSVTLLSLSAVSRAGMTDPHGRTRRRCGRGRGGSGRVPGSPSGLASPGGRRDGGRGAGARVGEVSRGHRRIARRPSAPLWACLRRCRPSGGAFRWVRRRPARPGAASRRTTSLQRRRMTLGPDRDDRDRWCRRRRIAGTGRGWTEGSCHVLTVATCSPSIDAGLAPLARWGRPRDRCAAESGWPSPRGVRRRALPPR